MAKSIYLFVIPIIVGMFSFPLSAQMQSVPYRILCGEEADLIKALLDNGEQVVAVGTSGTEEQPLVVKLWLKPDGEFTITLHRDDKGCMVTTGKNFRLVPQKKPGQPS